MKKIATVIIVSFLLMGFNWQEEKNSITENIKIDSVKFDPNTGLIKDVGLDLVTAHCSGCHSTKLIYNFRASKEGWLDKIRWMQKTQKLWDLGESEPIILNYLSKNYPAVDKDTRREPLKTINWYRLKK